MTSRSRKYFKDKKKKKATLLEEVIDTWTEKIREEIDKMVLEEVIKVAKAETLNKDI